MILKHLLCKNTSKILVFYQIEYTYMKIYCPTYIIHFCKKGYNISSFYQYLSVLLCILWLFEILRKIILLAFYMYTVKIHIWTGLANGPFHKNYHAVRINDVCTVTIFFIKVQSYTSVIWIHFVRETKHLRKIYFLSVECSE